MTGQLTGSPETRIGSGTGDPGPGIVKNSETSIMTEAKNVTGHPIEVIDLETGDSLRMLGRQNVTGASLLVTEDLCHVEGLGLLPGVIVKGQDLRGDSLDPDLLTRRTTARSPGTETDFPMTGSDPPLLSTRILVTTVGPSARHVTDIETISEKITFLTRGGLGPLSQETDHPLIMTKLRFTLLDREGPYLQSCPQGAEGRDPHLPGSGETGLALSADPGGHDHQSHLTLQMAIM